MPIKVEVWGDYACFTNQAFKTERVSYEVMTPSAARGLLDSVMWHPGMRWVIDCIHVCNPIRFTNIRRNEVKGVINAEEACRKIVKGRWSASDGVQERTQRASMVLRDVRYVIEAHFETERDVQESEQAKFQCMMTRRLEKGQCYHQPCFGIREFPANFALCKSVPPCPKELKGERDLGWMLLDMEYHEEEEKENKPHFFHAFLNDGILRVPRITWR